MLVSSLLPLERLKEEYRKTREELERLQDQKRNTDEKYSSVLEEEKKLIEEMRRCRDPYQYSRMDIRLSTMSHLRRELESEKEEVERKIRGYEEELSRIGKRIGYLRPR